MIGNTKAFCLIGKGVVLPDKVRVYHRLWWKLAPAKIRLNWNDDDSVPFIYYLDQKGRIQFGSSDERYPDLLKSFRLSAHLVKWKIMVKTKNNCFRPVQ